MFGVGNTIGAGVFALTGIAVQYSGPSLCLGFLFSGMIALCTAVMYAELSSRLPVNGSAFAFTYATFGELPAWLVGWNLNLRYGISSSGLARGISSYFVGLMGKIGWVLPGWLSKTTFFGIQNCCPLAPCFIMILSAVQCLGTRGS
jgi:APA family basic amino acid/polyamine antiporter